MKIVNARIDMRLIHGQVATMWTRMLPVDRIMVIDDAVIDNAMEKSMLKMACPTGVKLSVLDCETAAANLLSGKYGNDNIFVVVKSPETFVKVMKHGYCVDEITVGNMSGREGARVVHKTIAVTPKEEEAFYALAQAGVKIEYRLAPRDTPIDFMAMLRDAK